MTNDCMMLFMHTFLCVTSPKKAPFAINPVRIVKFLLQLAKEHTINGIKTKLWFYRDELMLL